MRNVLLNRQKNAFQSTNLFIVAMLLTFFLAWPAMAAPGPVGVNPGFTERNAGRSVLPVQAREKIAGHLELAAYGIERPAVTPLGVNPGAFRACNPKQNLTAWFTDQGLTLRPAGRGEPSWGLDMTLLGIGRAGNLQTAAGAEIRASGSRLEYRRGLMTEWYVNSRQGLEQGVTLHRRPEGLQGGELSIEWAVSDGLTPRLDKDGSALVFEQKGKGTVLRYSGLKAWDASGRILPARLALYEGTPTRLAWVVDDAGAAYPVTVDPTFTEDTILIAGDGEVDDYFGFAAISGDTVVIGSIGNNSGQGAAYVFYRDQGGPDNWGQVRKITATGGVGGDNFGDGVSIDGDTIVVGAVYSNSSQGLAYVFYRDEGGPDNWGQVKQLTGWSGEPGEAFGHSVSVDGDTIVVGARGARDGKGAAYVFCRNQNGADNWGAVNKKWANDGSAGDNHAYVSVDGDTLIVGANNADVGGNMDEGVAYVYYRNQDGANMWGLIKKLTASDGAGGDTFGGDTSVSGDFALIGACNSGGAAGSAYIFSRNQGGADNWGELKKLTSSDLASMDQFGSIVSISGDTALVGAPSASGGIPATGAAYVFSRHQGGADNWGEVNKLIASNGANNDEFSKVAVDGTTAVVGACGSDAGVASNQGAAYVYNLNPPAAPPVVPVAPAGEFTLTAQKDGAGTGTVTSNPAGIDCGATCNMACGDGDSITLTGAPDAGSALDGWAGADCPGNGACAVTVTGDPTVTATFNPDADSDNTSDDVENAGPNGGDANQDGILDSEQAEVATFLDINGNWCTLVAETGTTLAGVTVTINPSAADAPEGATFTDGFFGFTIQGLAPGGSTVVTLIMHTQQTLLTNYYRYGPTPDNYAEHWYDFSHAGGTGAIITHPTNQTRIELFFIDGARGDDDLTADGVIVDLGGPAQTGAGGGGGDGGSCFISVMP